MNLISMERFRYDPVRKYLACSNPKYLTVPVVTGMIPEYYVREIEDVMERFVDLVAPLPVTTSDIQGY